MRGAASLIPLFRIAERHFLETHAVNFPRRPHVEMSVDDGFNVETAMPVFSPGRAAPDREARYPRQDGEVAAQREVIGDDQPGVLRQRREARLGRFNPRGAPVVAKLVRIRRQQILIVRPHA